MTLHLSSTLIYPTQILPDTSMQYCTCCHNFYHCKESGFLLLQPPCSCLHIVLHTVGVWQPLSQYPNTQKTRNDPNENNQQLFCRSLFSFPKSSLKILAAKKELILCLAALYQINIQLNNLVCRALSLCKGLVQTLQPSTLTRLPCLVLF